MQELFTKKNDWLSNEKYVSSNLAPIRVLVVEDDEDDFFIISEYIKHIPNSEGRFLTNWCYSYPEAVRHIQQGHYDIYFVDYMLGEKTGLDLLQDARRYSCDKPLVLLTGIDSHELDLKAMLEGAEDYLVKSELNSEKLERCIQYSLERSAYIKALRANERMFHGIFEKSKDAIFLSDEGLYFKQVNNAATELLKYSREELQQLSLFDVIQSKDVSASLKVEFKRTGKAENKEVILLTKTKEKKSCILSISLETHSNGDPYVQGIVHDITSLKRIEKANLQIEKLQATALLLRSLAHEVRNPLTSINLAVNQLKPEISNNEGEVFIEIIDRNRKRIEDLISELLDSARPGEINLEKISLQSIIDRAVAASADRISLKKTTLDLHYPDEPAYVMADPEKLKIAFLNIVINAIEAVKEDSGKLEIKVIAEPANFRVLLSDNGGGIESENLSRIFDPYFTSKPNGFGLGLSTTLNILQSHKAALEVHSMPEEGTTFVVTIDKAV
jgi:PAS domain S-box-containing protein